MKSPKTMVAILAVSTLSLANLATAETQDVEGATSSDQKTTESLDRNRQRRTDRGQSVDPERRTARQQRREASQVAEGETDAGNERRARRSRTDLNNSAGEDGRPNDRRVDRRRASAESSKRGGHDRRADRYDSDRHARFGDHRNNDYQGRRAFRRTHEDRRKAERAQRRGDDHARAKHRGFDNRVNRRLSNQRARARAGWENGELTRRELKRIRKDQHKIARMDRRFSSDDRYTRHERRKLNKALDRSSRRVYRAKNNSNMRRQTSSNKRRW